ncbi:4-hydroxybenzoate polyprenyltransferase [Haloferax sp. Atlit-10N]|uniref:UbiA family prenyltransferase n=1 Tax=unclassified Haloferax TaxID=2625095 RepID=UPI000E264E59|nr:MULTISPECIES: UbiA family prenyltransferase [unclassified Haloferax]RDZ40190.1 4-hydroxybenzoate polyprenyltransferase [Haloferax sp. Atlit-16N]RDZ56881.1 4-hydroxybenzoate polyprenyltransferase [Haloferax sp. Atlit-10N]
MNRTNATPSTGGLRRSLASLARLVRVPNLFTAPPDVILGAVLVSGGRPSVPLSSLAGVALASVLLYAAGTTLNDYVDADEDAQFRPERPIPSGDVSRMRARNLGVALLCAGVVVAAAAGGPTAGVVAVVLGSFIALYDGALKGTPLGFAAMGGCRGANVALGMAVVAGAPSSLSAPTWVYVVPVVVALYIAGVTYMAERETGAGDSGAVLVGMAGVGLAVGSVVAAGAAVGVGLAVGSVVVAGGLLVWFAAWTGRDLLTAYADPRPGTIGPAVGTCVLALVVLNAAVAGLLSPAWGIVAAAFVAPAVGLSSAFDVS